MKVNATIYQCLLKSASVHSHQNALLFNGKYFTYEALVQKIDHLASGLNQFGLTKGNVITFAMPNVFEAVFGFYASSKLGLICHMVHPITPVIQMKKYMKISGSKTLVVLDSFYHHYESLLEDPEITIFLVSPVSEFNFVIKSLYKIIQRKNLKGIKYGQRVKKFTDLYANQVINVTNINPLSTAVYLHSGGTSGQPKTIELSHQSINYLASQCGYIMGVESFENKHMLAVLPMFHGFGLCMGIHGMLVSGGVNTLMPKFDPKKAIQLSAKNQINYLIGVPSLFESLLKQPHFNSSKMMHIDQAFVGGDYVSTDLKNRFNQQMINNGSPARLLEGYGLTEVVTVCSVNTLKENHPTSVGKAVPGMTIQIKDLSSDEILGPNQDGEIIVTGPTVMNGYLNDQEATNQAFFIYQDKRWIRTGDLGSINEQGQLFFKQRLKRIIKVSGVPVLPFEIENLLSCQEEIAEVSAISVPDQDKGNVVKLFIVWSNKDKTLSDQQMKEIIKNHLGTYAIPRDIVALEALPKTVIGKLDVLELEKM